VAGGDPEGGAEPADASGRWKRLVLAADAVAVAIEAIDVITNDVHRSIDVFRAIPATARAVHISSDRNTGVVVLVAVSTTTATVFYVGRCAGAWQILVGVRAEVMAAAVSIRLRLGVEVNSGLRKRDGRVVARCATNSHAVALAGGSEAGVRGGTPNLDRAAGFTARPIRPECVLRERARRGLGIGLDIASQLTNASVARGRGLERCRRFGGGWSGAT
jgi:hypothetical protein